MSTCMTRLVTYLRDHNMAFRIQFHPPTITAQEVAAVEHLPGRLMAIS